LLPTPQPHFATTLWNPIRLAPGSSQVNLTGGGGIYIASGATVYIDSFTVAHTINNTDNSSLFGNGSTANIDGPYIPQNC
jgi:hypothetical protein